MVKGLATGPSKMSNSSCVKRWSLGTTRILNGISKAITIGKPDGETSAIGWCTACSASEIHSPIAAIVFVIAKVAAKPSNSNVSHIMMRDLRTLCSGSDGEVRLLSRIK